MVQLYVRDDVATVTRPVRELKGFQRVTLQPGASQTVQFPLGNKELGFYNRAMKWVVEPGEFEVYLGNSSEAPKATSFFIR